MTNTFCPHTGGLFKPPALPVVMTPDSPMGLEYKKMPHGIKRNKFYGNIQLKNKDDFGTLSNMEPLDLQKVNVDL